MIDSITNYKCKSCGQNQTYVANTCQQDNGKDMKTSFSLSLLLNRYVFDIIKLQFVGKIVFNGI